MATKKNKNMEVSKAKPTSIASQESQAAAIDEMDYESTQSRTVPNGLDSTGYETHKSYRSQQHFGRNALVSAQKGIEEIAIYDREPGNEGSFGIDAIDLSQYEGLAELNDKMERVQSDVTQYLIEIRAEKVKREAIRSGNEVIRKDLNELTAQLSDGVATLKRSEKSLQEVEARAIVREQYLRKETKDLQAKIDAMIEMTIDEAKPTPKPIKPVKTPKAKAKKDAKKALELPKQDEEVPKAEPSRPSRAERAEKRATQS